MKTKQETHTPTPWNVSAIQKRTQIVDNAQNGIWRFVAETRTPEDAELIVRAVNSHEDLLEVAKRTKAFLLNGAPVEGDPTVGMRIDEAALYQQIKEAIAKAEGRS